MLMRRAAAVASAMLITAVSGAASAEEHIVKMLNNNGKGKFMLFEPGVIKAKVGDTVKFVPTNKGHNAEAIKDLLPAGAEAFKGGMGKEIVVTFTTPGAYGVKCAPHLGMGMVALVVVGTDPVDLDAVKAVKLPKKAQERMTAIIDQLAVL